MDEQKVEQLARELYQGDVVTNAWDKEQVHVKERYRIRARAQMEAQKAQVVVEPSPAKAASKPFSFRREPVEDEDGDEL